MFIMKYWEQFEPIDQIWHIAIAYSYTFIAFFALIANLLVVYYITKVKKKGRQDGSYFIINLALVDILKSSFGLPMVVVSSFKGRWVFGQVGCYYYGFAGGLFGLTSLATLSLMSIERFLIVSNPLRIFNQKFKILCILATWSYALIWSSMQFGSEHGYVLEGFLTSCSFDYLSRDIYSRVFISGMIVGGFIVPLFTLIIFLWLTKRALESKLTEFGENQVYIFDRGGSDRPNRSANLYRGGSLTMRSLSYDHTEQTQTITTNYNNNNNNKEIKDRSLLRSKNVSKDLRSKRKLLSFQKRQFRVLKTILLNIIFFCIAWTPYCLLAVVAQYGANIEYYVNPYSTSIPALISKTSSIYNPILYTLNNQECRNYFKRAFFN